MGPEEPITSGSSTPKKPEEWRVLPGLLDRDGVLTSMIFLSTVCPGLTVAIGLVTIHTE